MDDSIRWLTFTRGAVGTLLFLSGPVWAQGPGSQPAPSAPPAPGSQPPPVAPAPAQNDVVTLTDGRQVVGNVLQQVPGSHVTVAYPDGRQETFSWVAVKSVTLAAGARPSSPIPSPAPGPPSSAPPPAGGWQAGPGGSAQYSNQVDCSTSTDERCRQQSNAKIGPTGAKLELSGQSVRRLETPPSFHLGLALEANFLYGTGTGDVDASITGGGWLVGVRSFFGSPLPGPEGGSWSGVGLNAQFHVQGGTLKAGDMDGTQTTVAGGGEAGYQYFKFGALDEKDLTQSGIGVFLGYRVAYQGTTSKFGDGPESSSSGTAHGPSISLSFPSYNAGTTSVRRWTVSGLALIIENFALVSIGGGYSW